MVDCGYVKGIFVFSFKFWYIRKIFFIIRGWNSYGKVYFYEYKYMWELCMVYFVYLVLEDLFC